MNCILNIQRLRCISLSLLLYCALPLSAQTHVHALYTLGIGADYAKNYNDIVLDFAEGPEVHGSISFWNKVPGRGFRLETDYRHHFTSLEQPDNEVNGSHLVRGDYNSGHLGAGYGYSLPISGNGHLWTLDAEAGLALLYFPDEVITHTEAGGHFVLNEYLPTKSIGEYFALGTGLDFHMTPHTYFGISLQFAAERDDQVVRTAKFDGVPGVYKDSWHFGYCTIRFDCSFHFAHGSESGS